MSSCKSILVVEDDDDIRSNLAFALESEGYVVKSCSNGLNAVEYLKVTTKENAPGCIILDLMMPIMNGPTFLNVLNSDLVQHSQIPILVSTAISDTEVLENIQSNVEKLRKPIDLKKLLSFVEKHCGVP